MPLDLQRQVYSQINANPHYIEQIKIKHENSEEDIAYDIQGYENLKEELGK